MKKAFTGIKKSPHIKKLSKNNSAWLAGVIDGEGSVGLYDYGREGRRVCIQISNTHKDFIYHTKKIIGWGKKKNEKG